MSTYDLKIFGELATARCMLSGSPPRDLMPPKIGPTIGSFVSDATSGTRATRAGRTGGEAVIVAQPASETVARTARAMRRIGSPVRSA